ncbi:hypothetical protein NKH77_16695 [Streptomyces sp. M19]
MRRARHARGRLGQLRYPPEFRVPRRTSTPGRPRGSRTYWSGRGPRGPSPYGPTAPAPAREDPDRGGARPDALVGAATGIWRALRKLDQRGGGLSAADLRQVRRNVQAGRQALADHGLEIQEHDGAPFDSGQSLEVLVVQEQAG